MAGAHIAEEVMLFRFPYVDDVVAVNDSDPSADGELLWWFDLGDESSSTVEATSELSGSIGAAAARTADRWGKEEVPPFVEAVFSRDERIEFEKWAQDDAKNNKNSNPGDAAVLDRLLGGYEPLRRLCGEVDPSTRLYPLQKAIQLPGASWERGIKFVYEADVEVAGFRHPETGLLPFQLAASLGKLELTYHLLKANPTLLHERIFDQGRMVHDPDFYTGYATRCCCVRMRDDKDNAGGPSSGSSARKRNCCALRRREKDAAAIDWDNVEYVYSSGDEDSEAGEDDEEEEEEEEDADANAVAADSFNK